MKWIPAVALVVGFINCDNGQAPPPPPQAQGTAAQVAQTNGAAGTNGAANAGTTGAEEKKVEKPVDPNLMFHNPFLFKITKKGNHRTSWLLGTVNAPFPIEFDRTPKNVQHALENSTHAMFEVPTGSAAQRERTKLMAMNDGSSRRELGTKKFNKIKDITKSRRDVLDVMKPWVLYLTLEEKLGGNPPMDEVFEGFASSYRKRMVYLETVPQQVQLLDKEIDFDTLGKMIDEFDDHEKMSADAAEAYKKGDAEALKKAIFPSEDSRGAVYQKLIEARVPRWAGQLGAQFDEDATFAVVGIRYLIGPNNLVDQLKANGWTVERVTD